MLAMRPLVGRYSRTTDAVTEPVTLDEAKKHLRVTTTTDDALITSMIVAARQECELYLDRSLLLQTWKATYDVFPPAIELLYPPILGVTDVRYYDREGGTLIAVPASSYSIDIESEPGWIVAVAGVGWPDTVVAVNAVRVNYTAGYGEDAEDVPQAIRQWILLRVGHWYENREASIVGAPVEPLPFLNGLIDCYRVRRIA